jgi:hypothetical protein
VIKLKYLGGVVFVLAFLPLMPTELIAQERAVPLKNWATPLHWQPTQAEKAAAAQLSPQIAPATESTPLTFVAFTPCRLVDTRGSGGGFNGNNPFSGPSLTAGATATFPVQSASEAMANTEPAPCGTVPAIAKAYSFNITVVPHSSGAVDYITAWPASATKPVVSTLDDVQSLVVANAAIVPAGTPSGGVSVYNYGPANTDVIIDMNGFFASPTDLNDNTVIGLGALYDNTTGTYNTATGAYALEYNTSGIGNTANGYGALGYNTTGGHNSASGGSALEDNTTGNNNVASGYGALYTNTTGSNNTALGFQALNVSTSGSNNIAVGYQAGLSAPVTNSTSIYIGNPGSESDSAGTIQIGVQGTQTGGTYVAGIYGTSISSAEEVVVNSTGQLGTVLELGALHYKDHITAMGEMSSKLLQLNPVSFFLKPEYDDGLHQQQYGLIGEEVAKVYPELVTYGKDGQVATVKYQMLTPMLLNEVQKQAEQIRQQAEQNRNLEERLAALEAQLSGQPYIGLGITSSR